MKKKFTTKLQDAATQWFIHTKPVRMCRQRMLKQYANGFYEGGENNSRRPVPLNIIDRGVQIIAPYLVTNNPRVLIETKYGASKPGVKSFALTMELALAHLFEEIKFAERTLRPIIIDSLFGMGIVKTGVWLDGEADMGGWLAAVGQPYCDRVDFNDYIGDLTARNREEMMYEGNRYRLPLQVIRDSGLFKNYDELIPNNVEEADTDPKTVVDRDKDKWDDIRESVELQDFYLPDEGTIVTLPMDGYGEKILRTVEWKGPESGPYDILAYKNFPESIIPIPPVYIWLDIHKTLNIMARKMSDNCEREKSFGVYQLGDEEQAEQVKDVAHGGLIGLSNPDTVKPVTIGGFEPKSMDYLQYLEHQFAISYSNLYQMGGRGAQAKTLGQEQMLQANATRALDDMAGQFHNFTKSAVKKLAHFLWTNPTKKIPLLRDVAGMQIEVEYSESAKEGDFMDYTFDIDVYSMARMSPEMKFQKLMQLITGVIVPLAPLAIQQGSYPDVDQIVRDSGRYLNMPNLESWWKSSVPPEGTNPYMPEQGMSKSPGQTNDSFGATDASRLANSNQIQNSPRGGKPSPSNKSKKGV